MYSRKSGYIIGFHGCDETVRNRIVSEKGEILKPSENRYDWLGNGIYFWENNYERAFQFAKDLKENPPKGKENTITTPSVLGVVLDLGICLDLLDTKYLELLKVGYEHLKETHDKNNTVLPTNIRNKEGEIMRRFLDCAVIETAVKIHEADNGQVFDSVRGVFIEGEDLYENSGFKEKNHIQIAIRNQECIKGFFIPRVG
jgi:hypothetical protein